MKKEIQNIESFIAKGRLKEAIEAYSSLDKKNSIFFSFRYHFCYDAYLSGNLSYQDFSIACNCIAKDLLSNIESDKEKCISSQKKISFSQKRII